MCSVDIFAIMSGYFGCGKVRQKSYRLFELLLIVFFYSVLITVLLYLFNPILYTDIKVWLKSLFPPLVGRYWYITCFVPILFLQPILNQMIDSLSDRQCGILIVLLIVLFSVVPSIVPIDFFKLSSGYSCAWLLICYVIGTFLHRSSVYECATTRKLLAILVFIGSSFILLLGNMLYNRLFDRIGYMVSYISPLTLLMAIAFIAFFDGIKVSKGKKAILFLSSVSFDVYIIHGHVMIYDHYLSGAFSWIGNLSVFILPITVLIVAVSIYFVCSCIGIFRSKLFHIVHIDRLLRLVSKWYDDTINKILET